MHQLVLRTFKNIDMKTIFTYLIIAMLVSSCEKDPPTPGTGGGELPGSNETAHDPDLIKREELKQNLIAIDGTFENLEPSIDWGICGAASIVKNGDAKHGDGHLILNTSGDPCIPATSQYYNDTNAIFSTNVNLDAQPEIIYVSFYIKTSRPLSAFVVSTSKPVNFSVYFLNAEKNYSAKFSNVYEEIIDDEWQKITLSMEKSELVEGMFGDIPKYLNMSLDAHETVEIAIDNIRLTYEKELTQPEPMPANLVSNTSDVILMTDYTKNVPVTMNANGTNMVHYDDISTEDASCLPYWYGDNQITLAITNVTGFNITGNYNPGIGSDFYKYDLNSGNNEELYSTNGHAGIWDYEDFYAGEATHVTVKRAAWDYERSIGAVTVCGQNSTFGGVSDEFCLIYLMDLKGNVLNNDDPIRGNYASFSPNGKLAYITPAEYVSGAYSLYK